MIDTKTIRTKILDLAMRGKLTEQLPEDGTAEELYQQIQAEKTRRIKEGKIKRDKPLPEIKEEEISFVIPKNWKWIRLAEICSIINGDRGKNYPAKSTLKHEGIPFISALNLNGTGVAKDENLLCLDDFQYAQLGNGKLQKDDIVICIRGSLGKHGRYPFERGAIASSLVISRLFYPNIVLGDFEMAWLDSPLFPSEIQKYDNGTAQPNLAANSLEKFMFPLPPISEQERIVEKIRQAFSILDTIDNLQSQYFNNQVVLKEKLIDAAIRGKLTEQLPEDGTAEELYQQIQTEKQNLIKLGKLKKRKELPEIKDDDKPFEIPKNWKWVRVGTITEIAGGTTPNSSDICEKGKIPYFKVSDMNIPGNETNMVYASNYISNNYSGKIFPAGTTIFPKNGGAALTNKRRILTVPSAVDLNTGGCTPIIPAMTGWIRLFMETVDFGKMDTGSNIPTVNATNLKMQGVSLPPISEQKRIVAKLDELLSLIDADKKN